MLLDIDRYCLVPLNLKRYCPILYNIIRYYPTSSDIWFFKKGFLGLSNVVMFCYNLRYCHELNEILPYTVQHHHILSNIIGYLRILSNIALFCPMFCSHFVTKQSFHHFLSYSLNTKTFFYKSCSVWYAFWEQNIKSKGLAVNWSHNSHFVTFWTKHQIKKFFYNSCSVWYAIWNCHIKSERWSIIWSQNSHFLTF